MKELFRDYAIYVMLFTLLIAMVGSALMLILTQSLTWFAIATVTTVLAVVAATRNYDKEELET